jgi:UDP-GlcNAc3NAcA epimerase
VKVISIIGARPQFIKVMPVNNALVEKGHQSILMHTGQHYDYQMSEIFFQELGIPKPDFNLEVGSGSHGEQTGAMLVRIEKVLLDEGPDWLIIYGDTNSTLAGALAAAKLHIPVAHVEAGLRSFNREMPEEINRVLSDHVSDALFCPTEASVQNLAAEGIRKGVYLVGDVMGDVLDRFLPVAARQSGILRQLDLQPKKYILVTVHRAANTDDPGRLHSILAALGSLSLPVVFPAHPRTRKIMDARQMRLAKNIQVIDPIGYLDMLWLESNADCILTDSGGIQKEAYWLGIRCITLREETEWVETVQAGWNRLVDVNLEMIIDSVNQWQPENVRVPIFGGGNVAEKIVKLLHEPERS